MNKQKKPLYRYYTIILIVIMALNFIVFPMFQQSKLETTNYSDFLNKIEEKKIDTVQICHAQLMRKVIIDECEVVTANYLIINCD